MTDHRIHTHLQSLIDAGSLPAPTSPSNLVVMIFLDDSTEVKDRRNGVVMCEPQADTAFGYHNFFTASNGNPVYYSVVHP